MKLKDGGERGFMTLVCPVCGEELIETEKRLCCLNRHSFDLSASGYYNLLTGSRAGDKTGDNRDMVKARRCFLEHGYYKPLAEALCKEAVRLLQNSQTPCLLDGGCGEGYYTKQVAQALEKAGKQPDILGVDLSKHAVQAAAKRDKISHYAVASVFHLPIKAHSLDLMLSLFAPAAEKEFARVIKQDGKLLRVAPGAYHLWELKQAVYDVPYLNQEDKYALEGFQEQERKKISYQVHLQDRESIQELFQMTPYAFKTSIEGRKRLDKLEKAQVTLEFLMIFYKPTGGI